jgi:mannose-6-phosphate isomerase-like protein (cupin superfamily)
MAKRKPTAKKRTSKANRATPAKRALGARRPPTRRSKKRAPAAKRRSATWPRAKGWKTTQFAISHLRDEDFKADGLRPYAAYRDLGVGAATQGMVQAHVIRHVRPFNAEDVAKRHYHDVDFQLIYCLKGWMKSEMDGRALDITAGTCWLQPPRVKHTVLGYSDDLELLEIVMPAEFSTVEVDPL